jgi:hypothetical protein
MKATAELRWIEREVYVGQGDFEIHTALQQRWTAEMTDAVNRRDEWRDVPTVKSTKTTGVGGVGERLHNVTVF